MPARKASGRARSEESVDLYRRAEAAYTEAAQSYFVKRDWAKAARGFQAFIDEYGSRLDVGELVDRARTHLLKCQRQQADRPFQPADAQEWLLQGIWLSNQGRLDDALGAFDRALSQGAPGARVHYARAAALALADRHDEALESLRLAIEEDPMNRAYSLGDPDFERLRETAGYASMVDPPSEGDDDLDDMSDDEIDDDDDDDDEPIRRA